MTRHTTFTSGIGQRRRSIWFLAALLVLAGSGRADAECAAGELVAMSEPVVTVIAGPGDAAAEQKLWSSLDHASLDGSLEISLGNETFIFERTP